MSHRLSRRLIAALVISLLLHTLAGILVPQRPAEKITMVAVNISSALRIEHRPVPVPHHRTANRSVLRAPATGAVVPQLRKEIARITPHALDYQPKTSSVRPQTNSGAVLPQVDYEKTIAKLRSQNDPLSGIEPPRSTPAAPKRYTADVSFSVGTSPDGEGTLEPYQSWTNGDGYNYYRVSYWVQYPDGTTEQGLVPWPLRYLPRSDPFRLGIHHLPLPVPLPDFVPPEGTVMHPLVAYCYAHRNELPSCPIEHD